jgi:flagellar FliL protein
MADERAEKKSDEAEKPRRGKSNLILIVVIAVLTTVLVGGGITAAIVLTKGSKSAEHAEEASADEAPAAAAAGKKGKGKKEGKQEGPKSPAIYVPLDPPFVVNFDATQSSRFLQVTVEIMTRDSNMSTLIKENNPAVRNDLLMLFGSQNATEISSREGKEKLRKETLDTVRSLIKGEGGNAELVENVFFTTFVMQ